MNNRIKIILDELKERCDAILQFEIRESDFELDSQRSESASQLVTDYVYFILSTEELRPEFEKLLRWYKSRLRSESVKSLLEKATDHVGSIKSLVKFSDGYNTTILSEESKELSKRIEQPVDFTISPVDKLGDILHDLQGSDRLSPGILYFFSKNDSSLSAKVQPHLKELEDLYGQLKSSLEFEPRYVGHEDAQRLLRMFRLIYPSVKLTSDERLELDITGGNVFREEFRKLQNSSRRLFGVLSRAVLSNQLRSFTAVRLKAFMEWFCGIRAIGKEFRENQLAEEVARFIFPQGFFPFIRFKGGSKEPDMFALSSHEEMLFELKRYGSKQKLSEQRLNEDIDQAIEYINLLKSKSAEIDDQVFLLVFHYNEAVPNLKENPILRNGVFVHVVFIYLGKESPSTKNTRRRSRRR